MYAKIEFERLLYIQNNQTKLRVEEYSLLKDALNSDRNINPQDLGKAVILPSSYIGSPRYWKERTQDAMCYGREYGRPDLFITFTCNPKWDEITENLQNGQNPADRHDIVARVFKQKLNKMMDVLVKKKSGIFGKVKAYIYTVEWQKRGLPHAHILLWLEQIIHADKTDLITSAEIPDPSIDRELYNIVVNQMVHGPCGDHNNQSPCMNNSKCSKKYPKAFIAHTRSEISGYPLYRRRDSENGGQSATIVRNGKTYTIDNRWIVPYNPLLSKAFKAHINVEICCSVQSIMYIIKYLNKGSDAAVLQLRSGEDYNEVDNYISGRYLNSNEAAWRIFEFNIHMRHPAVQQLDIHLENGQRVYFNPDNVQQRIINPKNTSLTSFFKLNAED
ncbi:uncharacterized protein LOC143017956 [Oratosquilla oratoria]|uniref:uncharacterized protein LOC143017956 n=1 Tax=Oratosquilla oratoria TaxID=337810 RepID=UPI003F75B026